MSAIKTGTVVHSRLSKAAEFEYNKEKITVERSGGGL
jgi:hypothetical protein